MDFGDHKIRRVHRAAYALAENTHVDDVAELDHLCRVSLCAARSHLEPVTHLENIRRGDWQNGNRDKTHCDNGHPFTEANTYRRRDGTRQCRECHNERQRIGWYRSAKYLARQAARR